MAISSSTKERHRRTVLSIAVKSRVLVLTLFFVWRWLADPYDTSAELNRPCLAENSAWSADIDGATDADRWAPRLGRAIEKSVVWDGVYYVKIAECGYEYEQVHAFLPLLPLLMRFVARTFLPKLIPLLGLRATLALAGYLINNVSFVLAAYFLYRLTRALLEDEKLALTAAALFCFNPASAFYSAVYSESLFALLSFTGLVCFVSGAKWPSIVFFGLSSGVRSNGILHAGFFLFQAMHKVFHLASLQRSSMRIVSIVLVAILQSVAVAAPFLAFQTYGYFQLCHDQIRSPPRPWCKSPLPYLYGFVQSQYWQVGFLRYFQLKQLPNFLLASPMLSLAIFSIFTYAKKQPKLLFSLGLAASPSTQSKVAMFSHVDEMTFLAKGKGASKGPGGEDYKVASRGFFSPAAVCFLIQLCFMTAVAMFVMHVQVATRFLSVSPPVYWCGAHLLLNGGARGKTGKLIWSSFLAYVSVGSLLFINFYPFT
ncbi:GPI mannosyltransferase 2 [Marchantia polymorpha subsp. ruderalis]|uniref:GPI mannosyltransferase 2 n=1 Tax=Marchantia polymorpha TaxID=3197 RepID=A0A2R6X2P1_MARPO|nr:hypothetical protein MARPO_0040s0060 [Marchantia polymorpha]BBN03197.1 hypothetical protein Mp_2g21540 [Marchantia polymorpha subsp. ruderalis]|eukprot:PTQ40380.1 hypothetical protein MARPO_0040s0060 [Marchantia polymorpha]